MKKILTNFDNYNPVVKTRVTGALVMHLTLEDFSALKSVITSEFKDIKIIFQKTSAGKLWIKEGEEK